MTPPAPSQPYLTILSPVYKAEDCIEQLVTEVERYTQPITQNYEILLVEDDSPDRSWDVIEQICATNPRVRGVRLSRNFGQNAALQAGLRASRGQYVVVMDCDLQDHPKYIPDLVELARAGHDIVYTRKRERRHRGVKNLAGQGFHRLLNMLTADPRSRSIPNVGNYSILSRRAVDGFLEVGDYNSHYLGVLRWIGFDVAFYDIDHYDRYAGDSSYSFGRLISEAIRGITSQSERLLYISIGIGFGAVVAAFLTSIVLVVVYFTKGFAEGWTSVVVLILLCTGVICLCLGFIGMYIGKIFEQVKGRPRFLVREELNAPGRQVAGPDGVRADERSAMLIDSTVASPITETSQEDHHG